MAQQGPQHNPFQGFADFLNEMTEMRRVGRTGVARSGHGPGHEQEFQELHGSGEAVAWIPIADIFSSEAEYIIRIELPGLAAEDVDITLFNNVLTVSGERPALDEGMEIQKSERLHGYFERSFSLPEGTKEEDVNATFKNGLLQVTVTGPFDRTPEPYRVQISAD